MRRLAGKTVAIAGCGGVGGAAALLLARAGVGGFVLADPGRFDPPDANRQWGASAATLDENKARVYERMIREVNPEARVRVFEEGVTDESLARVLEGVDFVVDCLDVSVATPLRMRMYRDAQRAGIYCATAPIIGLGAVLMVEAPDGLGLEPLVEAFIAALRTTGKMPDGFQRACFPPHVARIEENLARGVASVSVGPAVGGSLVSAEVLAAFLHDLVPGWRRPTTLPHVVLVDLVQPTFRVAHYRELFPALRAEPPRDVDSPGPTGRAARAARLDAVGILGLGADDLRLDLLTDSHEAEVAEGGPTVSADELLPRLRLHYPFPHLELAPRGRVAEAWLAEALVTPGAKVLVNALFPTAWHHLAARGAVLRRIDHDGRLDLAAIERELDDGVAALWIELAPNASAGRPVTVEGLACAAELARRARVPLVLDACRLYTNAAALGEDVGATAAALCASADACTVGFGKEIGAPAGGLVGVRDRELAARVEHIARRMYGISLGAGARGRLARALDEDPIAAVVARHHRVRRLHEALATRGIPLAGLPGGHALFVDCPRLPGAPTAWALAEELYRVGGIRAAPNLGPPGESGERLRLAVPTGTAEAALGAVLEAFSALAS